MPSGVLASSASRGLPPREGLELLMLKLGRTRPSMEPRGGPQVGRAGYPHIQDADTCRAGNPGKVGFAPKASYQIIPAGLPGLAKSSHATTPPHKRPKSLISAVSSP